MDDPNHEFDQDEAADARIYGAQFEDESLEEAEADESLAATQEALEEEHAEIDAAASLAEHIAPYGAHGETLDPRDPHAAQRELLGGDLAWWAEDNDVPPLDIASDVMNGACGYVGHLRALAEHGLPLDAMKATVVLNHLTGPLVMAALQVLGTLHPHLREDITSIIREINDATPVATEDEQAAYALAHHDLEAEQMASMRKQFEEQGIPVFPLEDFLGGADPDEQDASLN